MSAPRKLKKMKKVLAILSIVCFAASIFLSVSDPAGISVTVIKAIGCVFFSLLGVYMAILSAMIKGSDPVVRKIKDKRKEIAEQLDLTEIFYHN